MKEEQSNANDAEKNVVKGAIGKFKKLITIVILIVILLSFLIASIYVKLNDDLTKVSETNNTYNIKIDENGSVVYTYTVENPETGEEEEVTVTQEEVAEDLRGVLGQYIKGDDEYYHQTVRYLLAAQAVTSLPYISQEELDSSEEIEGGQQIYGSVKFYRYTGEEEVNNAQIVDINSREILDAKYRITYKSPNEFEKLKENYEASGDKTVFNHFTMDEEGNVVVAYGMVENRSITTDGEKDRDLTIEMVNEASTGDQEYTGDYQNGFYMTKYSIFERKIGYSALVEPYAMPSNLLWSLLVQTGDLDFVKEIAELAYDSEIAIGIYDNENHYETNETYTYNKTMNINVNTSLNFSELQTSDPVVTGYTLQSYDSGTIPKSCAIKACDGRCSHGIDYYRSGFRGVPQDLDMYITETNNDGKIKALGKQEDAELFTLKYNKIIDSQSTPTVGVILANTWIAKWKASYALKEQDPIPSPSSSGTAEDVATIEYTNKSELLNAFTSNKSNEIQNQLNAHAEDLKAEAIEDIMEQTDFTVHIEPVQISLRDLTEDQKKQILLNHKNNCTQCKDKIKSTWPGIFTPGIYDIYNAVTSTNGVLKGTVVEMHYWQALNNWVANRNEQAIIEAQREEQRQEQRRKTNFEKELNEQIKINDTVLSGTKNYVNIAYSTTASATRSQYEKQEEIETDDIGVKFSEVFNRKEFSEATKAILARESWFWEYIRKNEDTAKLEDILRLLLNIATDSERFGKFTDQEIEDLLKLFEPKEDMKDAAVKNLAKLKEYIRRFENASVLAYIKGESSYTSHVSQYITEDKMFYYIRTDGMGHATVGFGIDIFNGGFKDDFAAAGYSTDIGTPVPVEFVDALEEETLKGKLAAVRTRTKGLDLKLYQIYALVSRAYNCGVSGALDDLYTDLSFKEAYVQYYDPEVDDRYGDILGDFGHKLYTNYMDTPIKSNGVVAGGLITRRKSEWTLFQTGYMDTLGVWCGIADYPEGIVTFDAAGYTFPLYPQNEKTANYWVPDSKANELYGGERYGAPAYGRTLSSSGCGSYAMSMILSGLLSDASIDPVTFRDAMEEYYGDYRYYVVDQGSAYDSGVCNPAFLSSYYGVKCQTGGITYDKAMAHLKAGGCVLASEAGAKTGGHIIAIIPVPDGYQGEFFVLDSACMDTGVYSSFQEYKARNGISSFTWRALISL